jgi:hypothetical protein
LDMNFSRPVAAALAVALFAVVGSSAAGAQVAPLQKRVASAVGEESIAVSMVHQALRE